MKTKKNIQAVTIALRGMSLLPGAIIHFDITRKKSIAAIEKAMGEDEKLFLIAQKDPEVIEPQKEDLYDYGTYAVIRQLAKVQQGNFRVMAEGICRCRLNKIISDKKYLLAEISPDGEEEKQDPYIDENALQAMVRIIKDQLSEYAVTNPKFEKDNLGDLLSIDDLERLCIKVAADMPWDYRIRQRILESENLEEKYTILTKELMRENQIVRIKFDFQKQLRENIDQNQKEYVLREQLKIIQQELGDNDPIGDAQDYEERLKSIELSQSAKDKLQKEISRLKSMPGGGQEANVIRTYLDTVFDIPFKKYTEDNQDIKHAAEILEADHYGLDKVKDRVIEYLAVRILNQKGHGPILCLVGPPGTGKTSVARSIARALGKKYVRISLGGVRDEAEIRGHRKTYVGAMPGRIVDGLRQAGVSNPLMLLDEIDKVSSDYKGDTSSALLEVLDGEQNYKFRDHYVEIPIDLSQVLFIATANTTATIPKPLLDRMELIEIHSYTENEKFHIAKDYLLKKQREASGISEKQVYIDDSAIRRIIHQYTREAGVRNLERRIGEIYRKCARAILEGHKRKINIDEKKVEKYLGKPKVNFEPANEEDEIGIARGLAWTSVGGDTLQIEVNIMPGKGRLVLTGKMGEVMKESAQTALSCIRALDYPVEKDYYDSHDIHLHIPEGAVPKDGPSAGITMATAMLSAVIRKPVRASVAMTGEITLRGRVLPVGGLKEKILAAKMAGIKTVLVPAKNKPDIEELSKEIREGLKISYMTKFPEVIKAALREA
ncbi:MAG: endopeptidase La [Johnsonella sp.]|nr:endopeptidase La [Johnsonella sp.]